MEGRKSRKYRAPKLTRVEKLTQGLLEHQDDVKARFMIKEDGEKGRGVFLRVPVLKKDSFVLEYEGEIISRREARRREQMYSQNDEGCFIMDFIFKDKRWSIDGTREFGSISRLLNHSKNPNIQFHSPIIVDLNGAQPPRIAAYALRDIFKGEEIVFDYGVNNKNFSWLKNRENGYTLDSGSSDDDEQGFHIFGPSTSSPPKQLQSPSLRLQSRSPSQHFSPYDSPTEWPPPQSPNLPDYDMRPKQYSPNPGGSRTARQAVRPFPGGEFKLKLACLCDTGKKKSYVSAFESVGQPQTIMRVKEDRSKMEQQRSEDENSVISLSSSDESSKASQPLSVTESIPVDIPVISSVSKVLQWQECNQPSSSQHSEMPSEDSIIISDVRSLSDPRHETPVAPSQQITHVKSSVRNSPSISQQQTNQQPCFSRSSNRYAHNEASDNLSKSVFSEVIGINDSSSDTSGSSLPSLRELLNSGKKPQNVEERKPERVDGGQRNPQGLDFVGKPQTADSGHSGRVQQNVGSVVRNPGNVDSVVRKAQNRNSPAIRQQNLSSPAADHGSNRRQPANIPATGTSAVDCVTNRKQLANARPQNVNSPANWHGTVPSGAVNWANVTQDTNKLQSDDCVVVLSDDECEEVNMPNNKDGSSRSAKRTDRSSSPDCEIVQALPPSKLIPKASSSRVGRPQLSDHHSVPDAPLTTPRRLPGDSLPSRPVGFTPPTSQPQVAVIKPFVSPAQTESDGVVSEGSRGSGESSSVTEQKSQEESQSQPSTSNPKPVFSTEEEQMLRSFFQNFQNRKDMSKGEIEATIARKWEFFSQLIDRGITLEQISQLVDSFK